MLKKITAVCLMCFTMNAQAGFYFYKGNNLLQFMRDFEKFQRGDQRENYVNSVGFMTYVAGVTDTVDVDLVCVPQHSTVEQVSAVVVLFMNANPARWSEPASDLVVDALKKAFPCKKK